MIAFVSLFLSLVAGPQKIEVAVGPQVAQVEILLDGELIGTLDRPPWRLDHDFGRVLSPRELVALARDIEGATVDQARQLLNVPHPRAGATLTVVEAGGTRQARLRWKTIEDVEPEAFSVQLDGRPLTFQDPAAIPLPSVNLQEVHLLTAEVVFGDGTEARAWTTYGGAFGGRSEAKVTAFPIELQVERGEVSALDLRGRVSVSGAPVEVLAVERGGAEILMVRAPGTKEALRRLGLGENARGNDEPFVDPLRNMPRFLQRRDRFNVLATWSSPSAEASEASLFPLLINDRRHLQAGLPTILTRGFAPVPEEARHRLADAVAAAGRAAAGNRRPRVVILVTGGRARDRSVYSPAQVRRYLEVLGVPLAVWHIPARRGQAPPKAWGKAEDISTPIRLRDALRKLRADLDRQRIVWVDGLHLPQEIRLDPRETRVSLLSD